MAWKVTQGVLLDQDGQPYAWKGQVLRHDDPVAFLKGNKRLVTEVPEEPELPQEPPAYVAPPPAPVFRPEPEGDDDDLLGLDSEDYDEEGAEL